MVVTFVSSALVLKGFLTQEICVSVGEKSPSKKKKKQNSTHEKTQQWHIW